MVYSEFFDRKTGLIILHPLVITFLLLSSYPIIYTIPTPFWFIMLASFIIAMTLLLVSRWVSDRTLYYVLFLADIPLIGAMIHYSGGIDSLFHLLYVLLIILAALYLYRSGAYAVSLCTVVFFAGLLFFESHGVMFPKQFVMYRFYLFGLLFLLTGILSGTLSERYQRRAEEAHRLRLTTEEIISNLPTGIITIDDAGEILYTNIPEGKLRSHVHLYIAQFLKDPHVAHSIELRINRRYYVFSCARIYNSKAGLGVLQDYTAIRKLEEKSRISKQTKLLAELGGSLAHEIRNPLASIRGSLEVVRDSRDSDKRESFINMALNESIRLNEIVTDFLNFAQFTPAKQNKLHIREVLNEMLLAMMHKLESKKIKVQRQEEDFFVMGDLSKLKSCFVNILTNAYEVSDADKSIRINAYKHKDKGYVEISDYGKGITKNEIKHIFEPFFTTKKGGIGLGLSIAKNIVEAHGGYIRVKSTVGQGTTFAVILPLA
jgi:two-component system sensor histidine kinase PilS (NtrC family)